MNIAKLIKDFEFLVKDNAPVILTTVGVVGVGATAYLTHKAAVQATHALANEARKYDGGILVPTSKVEVVQKVWKFYLPPAAACATTVGCIIFSHKISAKRIAGLAALYSISDKALEEYKSKVVEKFGQSKATDVKDELAQNKVDRDYQTQVNIIGTGPVLVHDEFSGRFFNSDMESIRRAENDINAQIFRSFRMSLNEFYLALGLPEIVAGESVGWDTDNLLEVDFSSTIAKDGKPCLVMRFDARPIRGFL